MWDSSDPELAQGGVGNTMSMETLKDWVMPVQVGLGLGLGKEGLAWSSGPLPGLLSACWE